MTTMTASASAGVRISSALDGQLLLPGDAGYDDARTVWNALVDRRPAMIVRCASVADVVTAVRTARDLDLEIGIRCGGHSALGFAVPDQGVMIDLSPMGGVRVDPARRRAWVQGGALLGALDSAAQRYGLATTAGNVSHTGVGGLTLGGGMGWLARQYRLTCDNVISFQVVTADGEVVRASRHSHPDLYWALRGGGGNFGVVTEFEFRLHPAGTRALLAELSFPVSGAAAGRALDALRGWRDLLSCAPRQATFTASIGSDGMVAVGFVWVGDPAQGRRLLPGLRALGRPSAERVLDSPTWSCSGCPIPCRSTHCAATPRATTCASCRTGRWRRSWAGEHLMGAAAGISCRMPTSRPTAGRSRTCPTKTRRSATEMPWWSSAPGRAGLTRQRTTCG
jgi:hypothetical protein